MHTPLAGRRLGVGLVALALLFTIGCGDDSSPTSPTPNPTPSPAPAPAPAPAPTPASLASLSITDNTATVTLAASVASDTTVTLSSSNAAVAGVPASVVVPAGQTTARVNVTTTAVSTATTVTITATFGGGSQSATMTVVPVALAALTFDPTSIRSQGSSVGTVRLTSAAPSGGATVTFTSRNTDALKVPSSVVVPAGAISTTFSADATTIRFATPVTVVANYGGVSLEATVTVGPPELVSSFTVTSDSKGADICVIVPTGAGGLRMDCVLEGKDSKGFPTRFAWTMRRSDKSVSWTSSDTSTRPPVDCGVLSGGSLSNDSLTITLELIARNEDGQTGGMASRNVTFYPDGSCGY